ncbi:hypothetical protein VE25_00030, partial [Devosia geojensis]
MVPRYHTVKTREVFIYRNVPKARFLEELGDGPALPAADLDHQPAAGFEMARCAAGDDAVGRKTIGAAIEGEQGIVPAYFACEAGDFVRFDIGRVGDDEVEALRVCRLLRLPPT